MSSTLFRGGNNTGDIKRAIAHVFVGCFVESVLVHNCVFTGNLGVPVSKHNAAVHESLEKELQCKSDMLVDMCDENMFAVTCLLKNFAVMGYSKDACYQWRTRFAVGIFHRHDQEMNNQPPNKRGD